VSICITATCLAHRERIFIRLDQGPPYPWVHSGGVFPCGEVPAATPEQACEVCACGCPSHVHKADEGPVPAGRIAHLLPCGECGTCPDFAQQWQREAA